MLILLCVIYTPRFLSFVLLLILSYLTFTFNYYIMIAQVSNLSINMKNQKEIIERALMQTIQYKDDRQRWVAEAQKRTGRWAFTARQVEFVIWAVKFDRGDYNIK